MALLNVAPLTLRERKRLATRRDIQRAAVEAAEERGLTGATVEIISAAAGVSPRTFFNHFTGKEQVLLGEEWLPLEATAVDEFIHHRSAILTDVGALLRTVVNKEALDRDLVRRRRQLSDQHAALAGARARWIAQLEAAVHNAVMRRLRAQTPDAAEATHAQTAHVVAAAGVATFRSAWAWWAEHGPDDALLDEITRSFVLLSTAGEVNRAGRRTSHNHPT